MAFLWWGAVLLISLILMTMTMACLWRGAVCLLISLILMTLMTMMIAFLWWGVALNQPDLDDYEWLWMTVMRNSLCLDNQPHLQLTIFIHITRWQLTQLHPQLMQLIQFTQLNATACKLMQLCAIPHATSYIFTPSHPTQLHTTSCNLMQQCNLMNLIATVSYFHTSPLPSPKVLVGGHQPLLCY